MKPIDFLTNSEKKKIDCLVEGIKNAKSSIEVQCLRQQIGIIMVDMLRRYDKAIKKRTRDK